MRRRRGPLLVALVLTAGLGAQAVRAEPKDAFLPDPPRADAAFYIARIAPWVEANCLTCHGGAGAGALRLADPAADVPDAQRRRADFERLQAFVRPEAPWESRLYLKLLGPAEGGDPHVGGTFIATDDEMHDALLDFVSGATLVNLPPEVWFEKSELRAKPGEEVVIDGRGSFDRDRDDMERLTYWWELYARPAGSRVTVQDRRASRLTFAPDTGGTYVFRLRVGDGKVWCAPRAVTVECFAHVDVRASKPGGISGLEKTEDEGLKRLRRLYLDVLGRSPTPAEAIAEERQGVKRLVENILLRAEMGRAWVEEIAIGFGLYGDFRPQGQEAVDLALRVPAENLPPHVVEGALARDASFLRRHPPGRPLAEAIARLLLDRPPSAAELAASIRLAAGEPADVPGLGTVADSRAWLVRVLDGEDFRRAATARRLARFFSSGDARAALGRALTAAQDGGTAWRTFLEGVLSDRAYLERKQLRPKETVTFVRTLFVDLLERGPTDREMAALVQAVGAMGGDAAALAALVRVMIDSGQAPLPLLVDIDDAPRWLIDRFLRYLGRRPSPAELKAYGQVLLHPQGGPELVIQALLTGPEYACR